MNARVLYNDDGEPYKFFVKGFEDKTQKAAFSMDGTTAVFQYMDLPRDTESVHIEDVTRAKSFARTLPFVQEVTLATGQ